ncbi:MAG: efflux RND transporter periplasmic adaptor subunit [Chitinophagaceae bacterium]
MMKLYLLIMGLAIVVLTGCRVNGNTESQQYKPVSLPVVKLHSRDTVLQQNYVADIQACKNVEIRAKVAGFIDKILVDEGQEVKKGQLLFTLSDEELQSALSSAKASLSNAAAEVKTAELELKRVKLLVDKNVISKTEYELAEAKLRSALAKQDEARSAENNAHIQLSYTAIRAPFNGIIDRIPLKSGSLVSEGILLTTLSDLHSMFAYFNVSENEYLQYVKSGKASGASQTDNLSLVLADGSEYAYKGKVETMESEFDENTGSIAFRAKFPNPDKLLKHGASGKVSLTTAVSNALIIPQKAVFEIQDKNFVFVLTKDNTVKMKSFVPKTKIDEFIIVESGLSPDDVIVYEGIQNIREGTAISPRYIGSLPVNSYSLKN